VVGVDEMKQSKESMRSCLNILFYILNDYLFINRYFGYRELYFLRIIKLGLLNVIIIR
jgi:hypothetical protein